MTDERAPVVAKQAIFHDANHASYVCLPVITASPMGRGE
jgi:hypothetical protein